MRKANILHLKPHPRRHCVLTLQEKHDSFLGTFLTGEVLDPLLLITVKCSCAGHEQDAKGFSASVRRELEINIVIGKVCFLLCQEREAALSQSLQSTDLSIWCEV